MDGVELKKARERLKLTQTELADAIGMQRNSIARMERNERPVLKHTELAIKYLLLVSKSRRQASWREIKCLHECLHRVG